MFGGIAILGAGIFAKEAHLPALVALGASAPPLRAVYSRSEKSAQDFAATAGQALNLAAPPPVYYDSGSASQADLDALLARSDIGAVFVVLPIALQPSIILKALAAGKHVLSEKPVAPDVKQGLELIKRYNEVYKPKGLIWRVAENFEAEPGVRAAGAAVAAGKIGKIIFFRTVTSNHIDKTSKWYNTPWRTVPDYQGGFLLDGGVHTIAALRTVLPSRLTHLTGFASLNKDYLAPHDTIHVVVRSGTEFHGTAELTWAAPTKSRPTTDMFLITGTGGWVSLNMVGGVWKVLIKSVDGKTGQEKEEVSEYEMQGVRLEIDAFLGAIEGKTDALTIGDPLEALRDIAFIQASLKSNGNLVDLIDLVPESL
ncbi:hypothetical protein E4T56_gene16758 [Termitomyces sp. T112]|nr:hypothetical protein E4T56_gene16758 [Termitomyces sp. T112]KAH0591546.1 hypothetical protein H2248_001604 [Termitomyces sp. 'cryptogamus']